MRKALFLAFLSLILIAPLNAQKKWRPFAGLHVSASADLYYLGPSYSAGVIHTIGKKQKWSWVPELTYFYRSSTYEYSSTLSERDRFEAFSLRSTFNYQVGKKANKGLFIGAGIGFQKQAMNAGRLPTPELQKKKICITTRSVMASSPEVSIWVTPFP